MENRYSSPSFLARPPRSVPLLIRIRLLLGGFMNQFGWIFFGFGMIFVWIFGLNCDPMAMVDFRGDLGTAHGKVTEAIKTNMSEGGGKHSDGTPIYQYLYEFQHSGKSFSGESYSLGRRKKTGDDVTIEFPKGRPERSRIKGMRTAAFPIFVLFVFLFPVIGFIFVLFGLRFGWKASRLLKIGEYTTGKLVGREKTNTEINNQTVYKLSFEFHTESGAKHTAIAKTHETQKLEDDEAEPLLYDPMNPDYSMMLDHLPGEPRIDQEGQIKATGAVTTLLCLVVPLSSVIGHSLAFYYLFLK